MAKWLPLNSAPDRAAGAIANRLGAQHCHRVLTMGPEQAARKQL